jgi:D-xylose transport system permease protein
MSTTPAEPKATEVVTPDIAPDGAPAALRLRLFGGMTISWSRLATTLPIYVGLILIWIYFNSQTSGLFTSPRNLSEMAQEFSYEAVLAIGVVFVLLLGEIDLSLGFLTLLSVALVSSYSALNGWNAAISIGVPIIICTICGLAQGMLIAWIRMPSFVVTLGGFLIYEGIAYHILAGSTVNVFDPTILKLGTYDLPDGLSWAIVVAAVAVYVLAGLNKHRLRAKAGLPQEGVVRTVAGAVGIALVLAIVVWTMNRYQGVPIALAILGALSTLFAFFATRLRFGRHIYAVGGNREAARRAGINTTAVRWIVFGISGMFAGIAGVMLVGYSAAGSTTTAGPDLLLDVISIAVIGGVSLTGGKGSVWAVLLGGLVLASINSGLNLMATDPYYVYVIKGAILLAAIFVDTLGKRWDELPFQRWVHFGRSAL